MSLPTDASPPNIEELTSGSIIGTGVFDILMATAKEHLAAEYDAGRISGAQYADVYISSFTAVLQQSITFLAEYQTGKKTTAEINLLEQQTVTELGQTSNTKPTDLGQSTSSDIEGLIASKKALDAKQSNLLDAQIDVAATEKALTGQRIITELAQTSSNLESGIAAGYGLNTDVSITGNLESTIAHTNKETDLIEQKLVTELGQTSDTKPLTLGQNNTTTEIQGITAGKRAIDALQSYLIASQVSVSDAEKDLTEQKIVTELGQTSDTKPVGLGKSTSSSIDGLIASKKALDAKQSLLIDAQIDSATAEKALVGQRIITELAQTDDNMAGATAAGYGFNDSSDVQGLLDATIKQKLQEVNLTEQKVVTELSQTSDTKPAELGQTSSVNIEGLVASKKLLDTKQGLLVDAQIDTATTEKVLAGQKVITELAQTSSNLDAGTALGYGLNTDANIAGIFESTITHTNKETDLLEQKMVTELGQTSDTKPLTLGQNDITTEIQGLIASKKAIDALQASLVTSQIAVADSEKALTGQKIVTELAQTGTSLASLKTAGYGFNVEAGIEGLAQYEIAKTQNESTLLEKKAITEISQNTLVLEQVEKTTEEATLLAQKANTELAQTSDTVTTSGNVLNTTTVLGGVVKKQNDLYSAQTAGYARDAEQKLAKIMVDGWSVSKTMGDATTITQLNEASISSVLTTAKTGIGL